MHSLSPYHCPMDLNTWAQTCSHATVRANDSNINTLINHNSNIIRLVSRAEHTPDQATTANKQ